MSLNYTAPRNIDKEEKIKYRNSPLNGCTSKSGKYFSPEEMLNIHEEYERLLINKNFEEAKKLEKEKNHPKTWLTSVISDIMQINGNGLIEILCDEFKDRGFNKEYYLNLKNNVSS